jgi:D-sedoheptulose 7-phosphate isomerase
MGGATVPIRMEQRRGGGRELGADHRDAVLRLKQLSRYNINIPVNDIQMTEDLHMVLDHCIMKVFGTE